VRYLSCLHIKVSKCNLTILTTVTLSKVNAYRLASILERGTCNEPTPNMIVIWILFRNPICICTNSMNDSAIVATSNAMLKLALVQPCMLISLHFVPCVSVETSQAPTIGRHWKMETCSKVIN
jgi:hypothetical protein